MSAKRGLKNSSKTRVYPAFSKLKTRLEDFFRWVNENQPASKKIPLEGVDWLHVVVAFAGADGKGEIGLAPSPSLLKWLVQNAGITLKLPKGLDKKVSQSTYLNRKRLFEGGDEKLRSDAIKAINSGHRRGWFILEGYSKPDVYIETNKFIFVVEGKRTEPKPTDKTQFLSSSRDQLTRHMDCALEISVGKPVYGMIIFEEGCEKVFANCQFNGCSVAHRSAAEVHRIAAGYLRPATWQSLQRYCQEHMQLDLGY